MKSGEITCSSRTGRSTCTFAVCGRRCRRGATRRRSGEGRVGEKGRSSGWAHHLKKKRERTGQQGGAALAFFFQAEDGIRDLTVTGVQTCALPISAFSDDTPGSGVQPRTAAG